MSAKKVSVKEMRHDGLVDAVATTAGFFERHRLPIVLAAAAVVIIAVVFGVLTHRVSHRSEKAARALSEAQSGADLTVIYEDYPETPSAPLALLQYGALAFSEGGYLASRNAYRLFLERYPEHSLADFSQMGIALTLEAEGAWDEAIEAYRLVGELYPGSPLAPEAAFNRARCHQSAGRLAEARRGYQFVVESFPGSPFEFLARNEWTALRYPR